MNYLSASYISIYLTLLGIIISIFLEIIKITHKRKLTGSLSSHYSKKKYKGFFEYPIKLEFHRENTVHYFDENLIRNNLSFQLLKEFGKRRISLTEQELEGTNILVIQYFVNVADNYNTLTGELIDKNGLVIQLKATLFDKNTPLITLVAEAFGSDSLFINGIEDVSKKLSKKFRRVKKYFFS